ncbi:MAG: hypothetical protein R3Y63_07815 [Eubacteriales bacterium]
MKKKLLKHRKKILLVAVGIFFLCLGLYLWKESARDTARWVPDYQQIPFDSLELALEEGDYDLIFQQTGLGEEGISRLLEAGRIEELAVFHRAYFLSAEYATKEEATKYELPLSLLPMISFQNSIISWEEYLMDTEGNRGYYLPMVPLQEGDILLTPNSHCFGWRQGHAALVVDEENMETIESAVLGQNSSYRSWYQWHGFPAVLILRPKEEEVIQEAVLSAKEYLSDVPYNLTVGFLFPKNLPDDEMAQGTHCAHLVWQAYAWAGLDLDYNGGTIVAPKDIALSENLEVVQIWGINPEIMWSD